MQKPKDEIFLEMPALLSAVKWGAVWNSTSADCCRRCCWCDTLEAAAEEGLKNTALLPSLRPLRKEKPRGTQSLPPLTPPLPMTPPPCSLSPLPPLFSSFTSVAPAVSSIPHLRC